MRGQTPTTEATERIARQIAATTAMTGLDAREFVKAAQAIQRAETTTATVEDADEVIEEAVEEALHTYGHVRSGGFDGDHYIVDGLLSEVVRAIVHTLNERGLLATARTRPTETTTDGADS